jgi:hypothetical protein
LGRSRPISKAASVYSSGQQTNFQPSFVITRLPDQGLSLRGDGSDYSYLWSGQTPLDAYYLSGIILPSEAQLAKGLVRNFLATQSEDGVVDWKPGLAGQRSGLQATPLLATLAWKIYEASEDQEFLRKFFLVCISHSGMVAAEQDRDGDGIPEWDNPMQTGFETINAFSGGIPGAGVIDTAESPAHQRFYIESARACCKLQPSWGEQNLFRPCNPLLSTCVRPWKLVGMTSRPATITGIGKHTSLQLGKNWVSGSGRVQYRSFAHSSHRFGCCFIYKPVTRLPGCSR